MSQWCLHYHLRVAAPTPPGEALSGGERSRDLPPAINPTLRHFPHQSAANSPSTHRCILRMTLASAPRQYQSP